MDIEIIIILSIWFIALIVGILAIIYFKRHKQKPLDFSGWTFGIIMWEIFITLLCGATIAAYLIK